MLRTSQSSVNLAFRFSTALGQHTTSSYFSLKEMLRAIGAKISAQFFLIARFRDVVSGSSSLTNLSL